MQPTSSTLLRNAPRADEAGLGARSRARRQSNGLALQRGPLTITLVLFGALSAAALWRHGYWGIIAPHFQSLGGGQVFADLVIALALVMVWMWRDAKAAGRNVWPWIVVTLAFGSFGPLLYLLTAPRLAVRHEAA